MSSAQPATARWSGRARGHRRHCHSAAEQQLPYDKPREVVDRYRLDLLWQNTA